MPSAGTPSECGISLGADGKSPGDSLGEYDSSAAYPPAHAD